MMNPFLTRTLTAAVLATGAMLAVPAVAAPLSSLTATFYTLSPNNPDVEHGIDGHAVLGLVQDTLGPDGLPVVNGTYGGPSGPITDVNSSGELLWWTPQAGDAGPLVTQQGGPTTVTLPYAADLFPNGTSDGSDGYTSARLDGTFDLASAGTVTLNLGSDDDAWVFIDGTLVDDNGGVHADVVAPTTTESLAAGEHTLDLFYADRHTVDAQLNFDASVQLTPAPVPEPASLALLGAGLLGLGFVRRRA